MQECCSDQTEKPCCCSCAPAVRETTSTWKFADYGGAILCRASNAFRMRYRVEPGLYALGATDQDSPVFVSANYKLSFDLLRKNLSGMNAWILVLDTKGINVWCAAGKGSFGTDELVSRIESVNLGLKVATRNLIVPQLGAPGIRAHQVRTRTGFSVMYGPIRSKDIKKFVANNYKATPAMRTVTFTLAERTVLIPLETIGVIKKSLWVIAIAALVLGLQRQGIIFRQMALLMLPILKVLVIAIATGTILHPLLLPFLPIRAFALQGVLLGLLAAGLEYYMGLFSGLSLYLTAALLILTVGLSSYLAFNFTGSTPIANKSGVKKEFKIAVPLYIGAAALTIILLVLYKLSMEGLL
jgi:hypothetical protein